MYELFIKICYLCYWNILVLYNKVISGKDVNLFFRNKFRYENLFVRWIKLLIFLKVLLKNFFGFILINNLYIMI